MERFKWISLMAFTSLLLIGCNPNATGSHGKAPWTKNYPAALKKAASKNKPILINFSGSDWCSWCTRLDEEVFSQPEFIAYAKENLICVLLDYPQTTPQPAKEKAANKALAQQYKIQGFPTVLLLNSQGELIKRTGYQPGGPTAYIQMIQAAMNP